MLNGCESSWMLDAIHGQPRGEYWVYQHTGNTAEARTRDPAECEPLQPLSPGRDIVITPTQYAELRTLDSTHEHAADLPHHLNTKQQAVKVVIPSRHFVILFILILYFLVLLIFDILCNAFQIVVHKKFPIALRCIQTSTLWHGTLIQIIWGK